MPQQVLTNAQLLIGHVGMHRHACCEWKKLLPVAKTWANFKQHFHQASVEIQDEQNITMDTAGHSANHATEVQEATEQFHADTAEAFANLATAAALDKEHIARLTEATKTLTDANNIGTTNW